MLSPPAPTPGLRLFMVLVVVTLSAGLYLVLLARRVRRANRSADGVDSGPDEA